MLPLHQFFCGRVYRGREPYSNIEVPGTENNALRVHSMAILCTAMSQLIVNITTSPPPPLQRQIFKIVKS